MKCGTAVLVLLVMACGQGTQPTAKSSPSSAASPSPTASPIADPPLSKVSLSCRLPILTPDGRGAFIGFPDGSVSFDPQGNGLQQAHGGAYYDRAFSRWLPVPRQAVSPDGRRYAYVEFKVPGSAEPTQHLHLVDVVTGNEKLYQLGSPGDGSSYVIVDFAQEGIWLSYAGYEGPWNGLFLLDLATGVLTNSGIAGLNEPVAGGTGVFWFTDPGPNPLSSGGMGGLLQARVQRLRISDGKTEPWFTKQGVDLRVVGTDLAGHPVITAAGENFWLVSSPTAVKVIGLPRGFYQLIADSHGAWFGNQQGIYLFSDAGVLQKVSNQPGYPANGCF